MTAVMTGERNVAPVRPHADGKASFRPDVQGLRALAVIVVILEHVFHRPAGGFVGVDAFFVISGFLITGLLLKEHERTGRISFADFYRRRVRRIMPLAVLVLVVTYLATSLLFLGERVRSTAWDALWAALFSANWRFAAVGTDYWQTDGPVSPLRHYWSLSVEEQFYFVWPVLLVLVLGLAARRAWSRGRARTAVGMVMTVVVAGSIAFAFREVADAPTVAYFSTFSRAWELGVGALLAVAMPLLARIPAAARPLLQWLGLTGLVVSLAVITSQTPFPVPGAFLPVLSTALVIGGGVGGQRLMFPLTNRLSRYVGDISYSLYLWHFPLIILIDAALPDASHAALLALGGTVLLSVASYHLVEEPVRRSSWLESRRTRTPRQQTGRGRIQRAVTLVALAATVTVVVTVTVRSTPPEAAAETAGVASTAELAIEIGAALDARGWPTLTPSLDGLSQHGFDRADSQGCSPATPRGKDCAAVTPGTGKLAVVVGDSMAVAWLPTIRGALEPRGWTVHSLTYVGCPFLAAATTAGDDSIVRSCPGHRETVRRLLTTLKPDLVFVSNAYRQRFVATSGEPSLPHWENALLTARRDWLGNVDRIVALQPPPAGPDPKACITRISVPRDCLASVSSEYRSHQEVERRVWSGKNVSYISTTDWFCTANGQCPSFVAGVIVRRDATHLTPQYARRLAPLLHNALAPVLG
ncbi:acyltransferase family protein [Micromonospora sp. NPDC023633]|uniref:acyltransferase family protein n=1 Tax=Micromonospora sp. NPDC023633 TaxID=3154320 RepID=UPI0033D4EFD3